MFIKPPYEDGTPVDSRNPEVRWVFLRKVYLSLAIQMLLNVAVASMAVYVQPVKLFVFTPVGLALYIFSIILPIIVLCHLYFFYMSYPVNLISLGVFTVAMSFAVGLTCAFPPKGEVILESVILTLVAFISLTVYTFWAEKNARKISFLKGREQYLLAVAIMFVAFVLIQVCFVPLERILLMLCGSLLPSLIFCGYIIFETDKFLGVYSAEEYVWAAVAPYIDIFSYFLYFKDKSVSLVVTIFRGVQNRN